MKKIKQGWPSESIFHVQFFKDDLEHIIEILNDEGVSITIEDEEFEYATLDELKERLGENPKSLKIKGTVKEEFATWLWVSISNGHFSASTMGDDNLRTKWYEVCQFAQSK